MRLLDDRDNGLDILQLAYMDHTMGMVIMLPRVKTNTWQATNSWRPRNLLAATPLETNCLNAQIANILLKVKDKGCKQKSMRFKFDIY